MPLHAQERAINEAVSHLEQLLVQHGIYGISGHSARAMHSDKILSVSSESVAAVKEATVKVLLQAIGHNNRTVSHVLETPAREGKLETPEEKLAAFIEKLVQENRMKHPKIEHALEEWMEQGTLKGFRVILTHAAQ